MIANSKELTRNCSEQWPVMEIYPKFKITPYAQVTMQLRSQSLWQDKRPHYWHLWIGAFGAGFRVWGSEMYGL